MSWWNPVDLGKSAIHKIAGATASAADAVTEAGRSGFGHVENAALDTAEFAHNVPDAIAQSSSLTEVVVRLKAMQSKHAPHDGPLMPPPNVRPLTSEPVSIHPGSATEILPPGALAHGPLTLDAHSASASVPIQLDADGEGQMTLHASAPGTDWGKPGSESATLSVFVDGHYNQDIVLYGGQKPTDYPISLGPLGKGAHTVTFGFNQKGSSAGAQGIKLSSAQLMTSGTDVQGMIEKYQPYFYGRGLDNIHSDVPVKMWAEVEHKGSDTILHYNVIHSNEDGGTGANPSLEQATWGRMTDPDPIADVTVGKDGAIKQVKFLGAADQWFNFFGHMEGTHPVLRVATTNNDYDDQGTTPFLFRPRVELDSFGPGTSRENLMDRNPELYRINNEELKREGKLLSDAEYRQMLDSAGTPGYRHPEKIGDIRHYLYVDYTIAQDRGATAVEVKLKGSDRWYASDLGDPNLDIGGSQLPTAVPKALRDNGFVNGKIVPLLGKLGLELGDRSGTNRTAVPLPPGTKPQDVEAIRVVDHGANPVPLDGVASAFMLQADYAPEHLKLPQAAPGEAALGHPYQLRPEP